MGAFPGNKTPRGQSTIEILIAIVVFVVLATDTFLLVSVPELSTATSIGRDRASFLATQGLEASRTIKDDQWANLTLGVHGLVQVAGNWQFSGTNDLTDNLYLRTITVSPVNRDGSNNITSSGGTLDPRTRKVTVTVSWNGGVLPLPRTVTRSIYFTDWGQYDWGQSSDADFSGATSWGGTQLNGITGSGASLVLGPGNNIWTPSGGKVDTQTTDLDWNAGTNSGTQVISTGIPAAVTETGNLAWTSYFTSLNWLQTTNTDFISGTTSPVFNNTQVVDTGDLGAVALNNSVNWAPKTSPSTAQMNDVNIYSANFGFGVGAGGVIEKWDGANWTSTTPVAVNLYAVAIVSPTDAWAVGGSAAGAGTIVRWNGLAWSTAAPGLTNAAQIFRDVFMTSTSVGWATGDAGEVYKWNGSNWAVETSGSGAALNGVAGASSGSAPGSFSETTDADFNTYTSENNTTVVGAGAAGSVALSQSANWSPKTSPTASQLNDVSIWSASLGFGVGAGGVIAKWDGANWTSTTPFAVNLYAVAVDSPTDAWAVGGSGAGSGTILHWNGAAWSSASPGLTTAPQIFRDIHMTSTSVGWATGDAGEVYTWNGANWTADAPGSGTAAALNDVAGVALPAAVTGSQSDNTDADFNGNSPTFTNTTVVGGSGSVSLSIDTNLTWMPRSPADANLLLGVSMVSDTLGYAVGTTQTTDCGTAGTGGVIQKWDGTSWTDVTTTAARKLCDVKVNNATDGWATADQVAGMYRLSGTGVWAAATNTPATWGTNAMYAVDCYDVYHCVVVGTGGRYSFWTNGVWSATATVGGTNQTLYGVQYVAISGAVRAIAVGAAGYNYTWTGAAWTQHQVGGTNPQLNAVSCYGAAYCFAVPNSGNFAFYTVNGGTNWTATTAMPTTVALRGAKAMAVNFAVVAGAGGHIYVWTGSSWSNQTITETTPTVATLYSVDITPSTDVVVGASGGTPASNIFEDAKHYLTTGTYTSGAAGLNAGSDASWGTWSWAETQPANTTVTVAVQTSSDHTNWSGWSAEQTATTGVTLALARNQYLQYRVTLAVTSAYVTPTPTLDSITFNYDTSAPTVFAASGSSVIIGRDGTYWAQVSPTSWSGYVWNGIDCLSGTDCWAVGNGGYVTHLSGTTWSAPALDGVSTQNLRDVAEVASANVVAVGDAGTVLNWGGASWSAMTINETTPTVAALYGVSFSSATFGVMVGAQGGTPASNIFEYASHYPTTGINTYVSTAFNASSSASWGTVSWTSTLSGGTLTIATQTSTNGVTWSGWSAEQSTSGGAIVSPLGQYIQYRATLATTNPAATPTLDSIALTYDTSAPALFAVSGAGTILGRNGASWTQVASFPGRVFHAIDCLSGTDCWAVADGGYVSRLIGTTWSTPTLNGVNTNNLRDVAEVTNSFVVAVGDAGTTIKWNGTAWASMTPLPTNTALYGVSFDSTTFGAAVGANNATLPANTFEWGLHYATTGTYTSTTFDAGSSQSWSQLDWDQTLPGGTAIPSIVAWSSTNGTTWTSSVSCTASPCDLSALPTGEYFRYVLTETTPTLDQDITPRLNSITTTYNAPAVADYYDLYMSSPTDGWAAGVNGATSAIAHWDGNSWSAWPSPAVNTLDAAGGSSASDVWMAGDNGVIAHWNGTSWCSTDWVTGRPGSLCPFTSPTTDMIWDLKCLNASDCRASTPSYGGIAQVLHWNGSAWSVEWTLNGFATNQGIEWISYVSANDVWMAADIGRVLHYNGTWSIYNTYGTTSWHGIKMLSATDGWLVGGDGTGGTPTIRRWNGAAWNVVTPPAGVTVELQNVSCLNANLCWIGGGNGTATTVILKWDGTSWSNWMQYNGTAWSGSQSTPLINTYRIKAIWVDTASHAWGVANNKGFNEFKSNYPATATWTSPGTLPNVLDGGAAGMVWNDIAWDSLQPPTTGITVKTRTNDTIAGLATAAWSSPDYTSPGGSTITSPAGRYLQYMVTFTSGNRVNTAELDEVRIVLNALTAEPLYALRGVTTSDLWSVGDAGFIGHYNGAVWQSATSPVATTLRGLAPVSATNTYAVGSGGRILQWSGTWPSGSWCTTSGGSPLCPFTSPTTEDLFGADAVDATHVWAVGTNGTIIKWDGSNWNTVTSGTTNNLRAVDMVTVNFGMAVGAGGVADWWNGTSWSPSAHPSGTSANLNSVSCYDTTHCFAVGDGGVIIKWDGLNWTPQTSYVVSNLNAVAWNTASNVWAVGNFGTVLKWDGTAWANVTSPTTRDLYAVNFFGSNLAWICGNVGSVLSVVDGGGGGGGPYLSAILDMDFTTSLPITVTWSASTPPQTYIAITARNGNTTTPDGTWNNFGFVLPDYPDPTGSPVGLPAARYLQYRATLSSTSTSSPSLDDITFTYR